MTLPPYQYNGARSMVILHEAELRKFVAVWKQAKAAGVKLPETDDPSYVSMAALLRHVLRAARGYMTWICENLGLSDPNIIATWEEYEIEAKADDYLEHLLECWREPLKDVSEQRFSEVHLSRWKVEYCIDAMMEHAVMHPIRHRFQLEKLMS